MGRLLHIPLLVALLCAGVFVGSASASTSRSGAPVTQLLVKFKAGTRGSTHAAALAAVHGSDKSTIPSLGVHVVSVPRGSGAAALAGLRGNRSVSFAERDSTLQPQEQLPNDPYFLNSGAWNIGGGAWGWYQTHTTQAWDITEGTPSTTIAILDTGIKTSGLSDFDGQISSTWNVLNGTTDVTTNAGNHGTYVAGVAGLALGNGAGNAGFCPGCNLMIVQVGTDSGASLSDLASGLVWAADHGARVANMSWAGTSNSSTLQSAIDYAKSKGLVVTAAAGNSNCNCATYPAADNGVVSVAGTDSTGAKASDSNYGSWVTIAAPEGDLTAWPSINGAPGYAAVGGTSMAAPVVAGIAGLLFSYNPSLTNTQVEQALEASAVPVSFSVATGRIDALAALQYLGATDPQASSAPVQVAAPQLYYEQNGVTEIAPLTTAPQVGQVLVRGIGGWTGSAGLVVSGLQWQRCDALGLTCTMVGQNSTYTVQSADVGSVIKLVFSVKNSIGRTPVAILSQVVGGSTPPPPPPPPVLPPVNMTLPSVSGTAQAGQTLTASSGTWTGNPTTTTYQWQRCDSTGANCSAISGAGSSVYVAQATDVGSTLEATVTASNSAGAATAASAPTLVVVAAPPPPPPTTQTLTFSGSLTRKNGTQTFNVTVGAGAVGARLAFNKCTSLNLKLSNGASASGPSVLTLNATPAAGSYTYTVSGGGVCSFTLTVTAPSP
jgi:subtilisin family serine protease